MNQPMQSPGMSPAIQAAMVRRQNGNIPMSTTGGGTPNPMEGGQSPVAPSGPPPAAPTAPETPNPAIAGTQKASDGANVDDQTKMIAKVLIAKLVKLL